MSDPNAGGEAKKDEKGPEQGTTELSAEDLKQVAGGMTAQVAQAIQDVTLNKQKAASKSTEDMDKFTRG